MTLLFYVITKVRNYQKGYTEFIKKNRIKASAVLENIIQSNVINKIIN